MPPTNNFQISLVARLTWLTGLYHLMSSGSQSERHQFLWKEFAIFMLHLNCHSSGSGKGCTQVDKCKLGGWLRLQVCLYPCCVYVDFKARLFLICETATEPPCTASLCRCIDSWRWSQKPGAQSRSPTWLARAQWPELSPAASMVCIRRVVDLWAGIRTWTRVFWYRMHILAARLNAHYLLQSLLKVYLLFER